jgi:hypothetical protein
MRRCAIRASPQWSVEPHWRQQVCGLGWSSANITEYTKGPADAPRKTEKVNV